MDEFVVRIPVPVPPAAIDDEDLRDVEEFDVEDARRTEEILLFEGDDE